MKKARTLAVTLLLFKLCWAYPQTELPSEKIALHTNTDFLLTGETLLFKVYCQFINLEKSTLSKIAYVELVNGEGKAVLQAKVGLIEGEGAGDFFLSSKLGSDHYTLIAYTQWMKNFGIGGFFRKEITIINPFRIQRQSNFNKVNVTPYVNPQAQQSQILSLSTKKPSYGAREKVTVTVTSNSDIIGNLSFGVHLAGEDPGLQGQPSLLPEKAQNPIKYLPELRGKLITGTVTNADLKPVTDKLIFLSVLSKDYYFQAARTDAEGKFNFVIEPLPLPRHLVIQCERLEYETSVVLIRDFLDDYTAFIPTQFSFNPAFTRFLEKRSAYAQIENSYYLRKQDSTIINHPGRFYKKADKVYLLDAFTRFPSMEDVFREYIVEVITKKRGETFELKVMDGKTRLPFNGDPVILLDGVLIQDTQKVMGYDPQLLKKIEIVTKKYFLGPATFSGVISLETFEGDARRLEMAPESQFDYEGLQPAKTYFMPNYDPAHPDLTRIPDYRVQLVWIPSVRLINRTLDIDFFTSDVPGIYEVTLQGISKEKGPFKISYQFDVAP